MRKDKALANSQTRGVWGGGDTGWRRVEHRSSDNWVSLTLLDQVSREL